MVILQINGIVQLVKWDRMDCSRMLESMEMPKFLNTPAKLAFSS